MRTRAQIVLAAADGLASREIGRLVGCTTGTVSKWRVRYARHRFAGLDETGNRGATAKYGVAEQKRILAMLDQPPPAGHGNWTAPLLARALGDIHEQYIWRFLRAQKIDLSGRKSWCESNDPDFIAKAADIVGLYIAPPLNAVVLSVDEKPSIQALERAQGYLKLPNGRAMAGQSHDYKRHGTTTLFAALNVATGQVTGRHYKRRRRVEFLNFMNQVVAQYPSQELHVILDNLSTHKPKRDMWLARHPNVHFHYTPTHTSWLNQIEIWFSILSRKSLAGASFQALDQLKAHINDFIASYNDDARPFAWTKSNVHQKRLKPCFALQ
jgi:transposase